ncbi:M15 family metallopeptidase [Geobacter sp. SVR]|uniref:M15 family metallopeptidase n=1 Tax=Geobacter sp. SVR TaxID=2495594 RepID=UPI00143EF49C|nr:M15 family metallopeptidase [Geobacter sp. SVR]BCS52017.1 hypothetical protein GSVR_03250 [Geobacter sp. SVR]GCF87169.1 hypothetical protein GSbR_37690 [Geobacter sp. SVR]
MTRTIMVTVGDTLSGIAAANYGSAAYAFRLAKYNGMSDPNLLQVGETLHIPSRTELVGPKLPVSSPVGITIPNGLDGIIATFGDLTAYIRDDGYLDPAWEAERMATARLPFTIPLSWDRSRKVHGIYCHKFLTPIVSELFAAIDKRGFGSQIKTFGGCFNYRPKRQSSKLSTHCWGIAIDLNPETNRPGTPGDMHPELVAMFREFGFKWGGDWTGKNRDPMHFQYCTGY